MSIITEAGFLYFAFLGGRDESEAEIGLAGTDRGGIRGCFGRWWAFVSPRGAEGLRWPPLSGIGKPGSGTEPIHQEHVMCSRFRGSCPSDVKSAGHPEPGFPIPLSGGSAALCAPGRYKSPPPPEASPDTATVRPSQSYFRFALIPCLHKAGR